MVLDLIEPPVAAPAPSRCNLCLHCGADLVKWDRVVSTPVPHATRSWQPVPHHYLVDMVRDACGRFLLDITGEAHAMTHDGNRYFGLFEIQEQSPDAEYHRVIGVRNSHDKCLPAGLVAGSQVLVCDNLCFSGEIKIARKHTTRILNDLDEMIDDAMLRLQDSWCIQHRRVERYKEFALNDVLAHDLMIRSVDRGVIPASKIPVVVDHWREPSHREFEPRNVWSLENAFTEALKGHLALLPARTGALHRLLDERTGFRSEYN
ncbi:DUF932 domain-containing protein [Puniceicoccales bacterium CK1056]|uniref:DUF932 domain-containing protein n=1 Tax=Oceanipulchritudo coccoides TaxID=2706888 RepID=A0A6B2M003_9BACT|nr:DUF932 domain-containing protein [Oceanipulchritudo coccoides]NDV61090.1 DUF932 domain-containing protein [Oceanipulchritudo coccoides]